MVRVLTLAGSMTQWQATSCSRTSESPNIRLSSPRVVSAHTWDGSAATAASRMVRAACSPSVAGVRCGRPEYLQTESLSVVHDDQHEHCISCDALPCA